MLNDSSRYRSTMEGAGEIDKNSFPAKTEERWDDARAKQRPKPVQSCDLREGAIADFRAF